MEYHSIVRMKGLQLFAEGAGSDSGTGVTAPAAGESKGAKNPLANVVYGKQDTDAPAAGEQKAEPETGEADSAESFESLIKGRYKAEYDKSVQDIVQRRLKSSREMESGPQEKLDKAQSVLDILGQRYGVDATNLEALTDAMQKDDKFFEDEAEKRGVSVQQLRQIKQMERENESLRRQMRERASREQADAIYQKWMTEAEQVKQQFPSFDLQTELENPQFQSLLKANVDVMSAFQVVHKDQLIPAAMKYTAEEVKGKLANSVAANTSRPRENGINPGASAVIKTDVSQLSKADRQEIARRVARGEKIRF